MSVESDIQLSPLSKSMSKTQPSLEGTHIDIIVGSDAFFCVLSCLDGRELIHSVSLVCATWADAAAKATCIRMLVSVGCDTSFMDERMKVSIGDPTVAISMKKDWSFLMCHRFPWAQFLSEGGLKRVYKVWNDDCGGYEALSVM